MERRCVDWLRTTVREREFIQVQEELPDIPVRDGIGNTLSVQQLLSKMDSRLATILRLYYLEALIIQEIAEVTNVLSGAVKSRLFYARKMMTNLLENVHE